MIVYILQRVLFVNIRPNQLAGTALQSQRTFIKKF